MSEKLHTLGADLLQSTTAAEIGNELETMLSVFIQYAPVDRLSLANTAGIATKLITFFNRLETTLQQELLEAEPF